MYLKPRCNPWSGPGKTLEGAIRERARAAGGISFAAFMEAALYTPGCGYYARARSPWGPDGDYITAPQVGGALATAVAALVIEAAELMEAGHAFHLVEFGSGDGALLRALLRELATGDPSLYGRLRLICVERSTPARRHLEAVLEPPPGGLRLLAELGDLGTGERLRGAVISNEFLDALPVERLSRRDGRLVQSWIEVRDERLVESFRHPADGALEQHLQHNGVTLIEGQVAEVCPGVASWVSAVAGVLEEGVVLTVDYGHETAALYGESRLAGTLLCQRRFALSDDPLAAIGDQDITAHVDFGNLRRLGALHGLDRGELCSLRVFLIGTGPAGAIDGPGQRMARRHLLVSEIADTQRVMLQTRGARLAALRFGRQRLEPGAAAPC